MYQLVYVSVAARPPSDLTLRDILRSSRRNNEREGLTGVLLQLGRYYMQVLEGRREAVETMFERIAQDPRHDDIKVLMRRRTAQREFSEWAMGYRDLDQHTLTFQPLGFKQFVKEERPSANPTGPAHEALSAFVELYSEQAG